MIISQEEIIKDIIVNTILEEYERIEFFHIRTNKHIERVITFGKLIKENFKEFPEIVDRCILHDQSKFFLPEVTSYIFLTWFYNKKTDNHLNPPKRILDNIDDACYHHYMVNSHHPEFHDPHPETLFNNGKLSRIVDGKNMPDLDIAEMVCDWCSMSEELHNSPLDWARRNVNVKWQFTETQTNLIYSLLNKIWG